MNPRIRAWIEALKILDGDPSAKVPCPECGKANLEIIDVVPKSNPSFLDRHLVCRACGARQVASKRQEPPPKRIS